MAPLPTGRLSEQVAHRRGSMGGLLLQVPSRPVQKPHHDVQVHTRTEGDSGDYGYDMAHDM